MGKEFNCCEESRKGGDLRFVHLRAVTKTSSHPPIRLDKLKKQLEWKTLVHFVILNVDYHSQMINYPQNFNQFLRNKKYSEAIVKILNENRENLLHTACKHNCSEYIIPLLIKGCDPAKQNLDGRTPLHIALENNSLECITEFLKFMKNPQLYNTADTTRRTYQRLEDMFRFYDNKGYTIIHLCVLKKLSEILKEFLQFCLKHNIDVLQSEVLGCGDSLLHLAVKMHELEMANVIVHLLPESVKIRNYPGALAYDVDSITEEMRRILRHKGKRSIIK